MRRPCIPAFKFDVKSGHVASMLFGSRGSCPAIAFNMMALSSTVHVKGPQTSAVWESGRMPLRPTRPDVGFRPVSEQKLDGPRIEPPVSVPSEPSTSPVAIAGPQPELEPPGVCAKFQGFLAAPKGPPGSGLPTANSCVLNFPT